MNIQQDFKELLALLEENNVDYMIVGSYAVAFYGYPRFTKDIDIFFDSSMGNIEKKSLPLKILALQRMPWMRRFFWKKATL
jgi:hypothetical protein